MTKPQEDALTQAVREADARGMSVNDEGCQTDTLVYCGGVQVQIAASRDWPEFVRLAVEREWVGVERLGGCAGTIGQAVAANAGAFGQSVADTVAAVHTWDRARGARRYFALVDCEFDGDGSRFLRERMPDGSMRFVLLEVELLFRQGDLSYPIEDADLTARLRIREGERAPLSDVYAAAIANPAG